jgi:alpha-tubulin suppressor-like RCC1 family protein
MAGFNSGPEGSFDRIFMTTTDLIDQFVGESLFGIGLNNFGQIGDTTLVSRSSPVQVFGGGVDWKQVSGGASNSAAIKTDGTLWTWGRNANGQIGDNTSSTRSSPVTTTGGGTNWQQVSAGLNSFFTSAIKTDGTLWTWGQNTFGALGDGTSTVRSSPVTTTGGGTNWRQVSGGQYHCAAIKTDGTLWAWGRNASGQLGTSTATSINTSPITTSGGGSTWKQVASGANHTAAIKTDGTLWTWGENTFGTLGDGTASSRSSPVTTSGGGTNWKQVACGNGHTAAVKTDGTLWTWGYNQFFRLGDGTSSDRSSPVTTTGGGTNWKQVAAGNFHTVAIKTDGTLWSCGYNATGCLGDNTSSSRSSLVQPVGAYNNWKQVAAGGQHTMGIVQVN